MHFFRFLLAGIVTVTVLALAHFFPIIPAAFCHRHVEKSAESFQAYHFSRGKNTSEFELLTRIVKLETTQFAFNADALVAELVATKKRAAALRRQVGELSCRLNGIGPTGGFCLDSSHIQVGGNDAWSPALGIALAAMFEGCSVLSLGAGLANYEKQWEKNGIIGRGDGTGIKSVGMFDGAENIELVTDGRVKFADLTEPLDKAVRPADWVLSLEVGEHIAAGTATAAFVRNLHQQNIKGIVVSWSVPGQGGHFHVNNLSSERVIALFLAEGSYKFDLSASLELRRIASAGECCNWFRETIYVFRKLDTSKLS